MKTVVIQNIGKLIPMTCLRRKYFKSIIAVEFVCKVKNK